MEQDCRFVRQGLLRSRVPTMWVLQIDRWLKLSILTAASLLLAASQASAQPVDPVEDLRAALREPEDLLSTREGNLLRQIEALKTIPQLRRALMLNDWMVDPFKSSEKARKIDVPLRQKIADRLIAQLKAIVESDDNSAKLAVANLIAEMGPAVRSVDPGDAGGFARSLTPQVLQLAQDRDLAVRQEALRALGNINPKPSAAIPVFRNVLEKDSLGPRRLAADGLGQLIRVISFLRKPGQDTTGVGATAEEVLALSREVIANADAGLGDEDAQVRALSLIAIQLAAQTIAEQIPETVPTKKSNSKAVKAGGEDPRLLRLEMTELTPALQTIAKQAPTLVQALRDPSPLVKYSAIQALESAGKVRLRMRRRFLAAPPVKDEIGDLQQEAEAFVLKNDPLAPLLDRNLPAAVILLKEPEAKLRRATLDFLEVLEEAATPALAEVTASLSDPDRFVRWSAARVLYYVPPEKAALAVPHLARLLADPDLRVRNAAADTLKGMGSLAKEAAPALARAVAEGDVEARLPAMQVLQQLPAEYAQVAVPQLSDGLRHPDPRMRRAAAETLGKLGGAARAAIPALRRALGDEDPEVRVNSSDAILTITLDAK